MAVVGKLLSWVFPYRIKRLEGKLTKVLEVTFENGKKVLNAGEVNYSYGALHAIFRIALNKANIITNSPSNVLILGFGAGSIASILVDEFGQDPILIGVEADPVVLQLARQEFNIERFLKLELFNCTAELFMSDTIQKIPSNKFDLIAVDVFVEGVVPGSVMNINFLESLYKHLNLNGGVVFNEMPVSNFSDEDDFSKKFKSIFDESEIHLIGISDTPNRIFIGKRKN